MTASIAQVMWKLQFSTIAALIETCNSQGVVGPSHATFRSGYLTFWNCHFLPQLTGLFCGTTGNHTRYAEQ